MCPLCVGIVSGIVVSITCNYNFMCCATFFASNYVCRPVNDFCIHECSYNKCRQWNHLFTCNVIAAFVLLNGGAVKREGRERGR